MVVFVEPDRARPSAIHQPLRQSHGSHTQVGIAQARIAEQLGIGIHQYSSASERISDDRWLTAALGAHGFKYARTGRRYVHTRAVPPDSRAQRKTTPNTLE